MSGLGAAWYRSLKSASRAGISVQPAVSDPVVAVRAALGVAIALFGALILVGRVHAVLPALGAELTGMATLQPGFRRGPGLPLAVTVGLFAAAFVGNALAPWPAAFTFVLAAWAFGAALFWSFGQAAGQCAAMTVPVMLTIVRPPQNFADAVLFASEIGAGAGVQVLLLWLWPERSWNAQRGALADACASVADYARQLQEDPLVRFDPSALARARDASTLTPRQARHRPAQLFGVRVLVDEARAALAALADPRGREDVSDQEREDVRALLGAAAEVLDNAARSIRTGVVVAPSQVLFEAMEQASGSVRLGEVARRAADRLIELLTEVDSILRHSPAGGSGHGGGRRRILRRPGFRKRFARDRRTYLAPLHGDSPVLRHAVRVALVVGVADGINKLLNVQHGYWAALTVMMVSRPDFSQTFGRGVARFVGTIAGVALASLAVELGHPDKWVCAALATVCAAGLFFLMRSGYLAVSTLLTAYVVFLLSMAGTSFAATAVERVGLTLLGGVLTLVSYALWPSWHTVTLSDRLADLIDSAGEYAAASIDAVAEPGEASRRRLRDALLDSRDDYLTLEETAMVAAAEPVRGRGPNPSGLERAHEAVAGIFRAAIVLQLNLPDPDAPPRPAAGAFAQALRRVFGRTASAVRSGVPETESGQEAGYQGPGGEPGTAPAGRPPPDLDEAFDAWVGSGDGTPGAILHDAGTLIEETRRLRWELGSLDGTREG